MNTHMNNSIEFQKEWATKSLDFSRKFTKAMQLILDNPQIEVGTSAADVVYEENKLKLLHYRPLKTHTDDKKANSRASTSQRGGNIDRNNVPVLVIYALINRPYILDLQPDRSVIQNLLGQGFDVYMLDWGVPNDSDRFLTLNDYVNGYINNVVDFICAQNGVDQISILGYCMGGTLSVMYTALHSEKVKNLILMAAPLDFHVDTGLLHIWADKKHFNADKIVEAFGNVPGELLNMGFTLLDPINNIYLKYLNFVDNIDNEDFIEMFLRMEKWIYDGIPLAGEAYREFIKMGYHDNSLIKSRARINGSKIDLNNITMPVLNIAAKYDNLVPPEASRTFNDVIPSKDKSLMEFPKGHIGLSVSASAHTNLWPKVGTWLKKRSRIPRDTNVKGNPASLMKIKGIGLKSAQKLKLAGITGTADLVAAVTSKLSNRTGIPQSRIKGWQTQARA